MTHIKSLDSHPLSPTILMTADIIVTIDGSTVAIRAVRDLYHIREVSLSSIASLVIFPFSLSPFTTPYLGNSGYRVRGNNLEQLLSEFGEVSNARVVTDRTTGRLRGLDFADTADKDARRAIEALSEQESEGRHLLIREARNRPHRERHF